MTYRSAAALEMAVKQVAKDSPLDTNRALAGFYFHRLLCRVFADGNDSFVLKGGQGVLARTLDARATRDIDLLSRRGDIETALSDLRTLVERDLGDFILFKFEGAEPIKADDEYRSGMSVKFVPWIGAKRTQPISIDLVVDEVPLEKIDRVAPVDRLPIKGLMACDYLVYPVEAALADKLCALMERHDGRASSRVKDLVDITVYALTCDIDGDDLLGMARRETAVRGLASIQAFALPDEWGAAQAKQFAKLCAQTGLPAAYRTMDAAAELASMLFGPMLDGSVAGLTWRHEAVAWEE